MVQKKKPVANRTIENRRARFDYALGQEIIAGLALNGREARAARDGHVQLKGAFVTIHGNELWLNNASFSLKITDVTGTSQTTVDTSPRKLLVHRAQITELTKSHETGMTIVPLKLLVSGRHIKAVIALGKGKKTYDKRQTIKRRDQERDLKRMKLL